MFSLGRRDRLQPEIKLDELTVMQNEYGKPLSLPMLGKLKVVVCGITGADGVERLTVCKELCEMENEYTFFFFQKTLFADLRWYAASRKACESALNGLVANAV